jgi:hypothetical protein
MSNLMTKKSRFFCSQFIALLYLSREKSENRAVPRPREFVTSNGVESNALKISVFFKVSQNLGRVTVENITIKALSANVNLRNPI